MFAPLLITFVKSTQLTRTGSWANQVGPYQYYIHGNGAVTNYVNLSPSFKNSADAGSKQGAKITIDNTATWNSDMWRTELIPQTKAAIASGKVYYHFSIKRSTTNVPSATNEHQIAFFESHFTELKYGWVNGESGTSNTNLQWFVGGQSKWKVELVADVWHNVAYEIVRCFSPLTSLLPFLYIYSPRPLNCFTGNPKTNIPSGLQRTHRSVLALHGLQPAHPDCWSHLCEHVVQRRRLALGCPPIASPG